MEDRFEKGVDDRELWTSSDGAPLTVAASGKAWLLTLVEGMPQLVWRAVGEGSWTWASPQWERYTGQSLSVSSGAGWMDAVHPEDRDVTRKAWSLARDRGEYAAELRVADRDGNYRWFQCRGVPVCDSDGSVIEWLGTSTDVDDLRRLQAEQKVLVGELQHRTRNLIAVVSAIASETIRGATSLADFKDRFQTRLAALSRVQGLLSSSEQEPITIRKLLTMELCALAADRLGGQVEMAGPKVVLRSGSAQAMALALHELSTNALKYGALSACAGRLSITWSQHLEEGRPWLSLQWRESGIDVPEQVTEKPKGFGRVLIEQALPHQLGARTSFRVERDSLTCSIDLPLQRRRSGEDRE